MASQQQSGRAASRARRQMQVNGKGRSAAAASPPPTRQGGKVRKPVSAAAMNPAPTQAPTVAAAPVATKAPAFNVKPKRVAKSASRLRRETLASRGKSGDRSSDRQRSKDMAMRNSTAASAKAISDGKCGCGGDCCKKAEVSTVSATSVAAPFASAPVAPARVVRKGAVAASNVGRMLSRARRAAMAGRGKAGLEAHNKGNSTASLARQANPDISAREVARVVRETRSKNGARGSAAAAPTRTRRPRNAAEAKVISGTNVSHTEKMTGDESGLCHAGVTGTSYMSSEVFEKFCQTEPPKAPVKVEETATLSGSRITSGGKVGSSAVMTGNEAGSCDNVTGTEYLGSEHFSQMCDSAPKAMPAKVSHSQTQRGQTVSGPKSNRAENVTGNMKGTCEAITGTPYTGGEVFTSFCAPEDQRKNQMRTVMPERAPGAGKDITGQQPGLRGNKMTGTEEGACQSVSGTPYIASSEMGSVCAATSAQPGEADFPQSLSEGTFSVLPSVAPASAITREPAVSALPSVAPASAITRDSVTGSGYQGGSSITGAFSMGQGKVSGTEESRFGNRSANVIEARVKPEQAPVSRVTGEGMDTGLNITGNDWDRGDHVTGTEGRSATRRNPSRSGPMNAMPEVASKREPQVVRESANVTGGSGGSQGASSITLSGGARG